MAHPRIQPRLLTPTRNNVTLLGHERDTSLSQNPRSVELPPIQVSTHEPGCIRHRPNQTPTSRSIEMEMFKPDLTIGDFTAVLDTDQGYQIFFIENIVKEI